MVSKKRRMISQTIFFFLNDIGDKFNALALKRLVDYLFILSEKIIIHFPRNICNSVGFNVSVLASTLTRCFRGFMRGPGFGEGDLRVCWPDNPG